MSKYLIENPNGATVTIMVPWDCDNACAFCVNKCEYKDGFDVDMAMDKILNRIKVMHKITPKCDFVITGGEPFADCENLEHIINAIPKSHNIYINTTLPVMHKPDIYTFVRIHKERISCINISRHIWTPVDGANSKFIKKIAQYVRVRINSVIPNWVQYTEKNDALLEDFFEEFWDYEIQIRSDYRDITTQDIEYYKLNPVYTLLKECGVYEHWLRSEANRIGVKMELNGKAFTWHLTCDYSKIKKDEETIIMDVIINQNGEIMDDWNEYGQPLDLDNYTLAVRSDKNA